MFKVICFAGTTEGKEMISFLCENQIQTIGCIATEYGETLLTPSAFLTTQAKRMDEKEMKDLFETEKPDLILDATHPFAKEVTKNIKQAAKECKILYLRLLREEKPVPLALYFEDEEKASEYLTNTKGNILLTTGSKNLAVFTSILDYQNRCYARVLSLPSVVGACKELGFYGKNLFAMQGPFSETLNYALLKEINASYLVTKESGKEGGFFEKAEAAKRADVTLIVIKRPKEEGYNITSCKKEILERIKQKKAGTSIKQRQEQMDKAMYHIACIGIGVGAKEYRTHIADEFILQATHKIGAARMLAGVDSSTSKNVVAITAQDILKAIQEIISHNKSAKIAVLFSGDTGFYSGTKKLVPLLEEFAQENKNVIVQILPGISSMSYLAAKAKLSYEDAKILSLHGKEDDLVHAIKHNYKVFSIFGKIDDVSNTCKELAEDGYGDVLVYLGENLGYKEELIQKKKVKECVNLQTKQLVVAFFINEHVDETILMSGIPDDMFLRDKVPMTKEEIRTIVIAKLKLTKHAIVYDIGAGTGSVAIEAERLVKCGKVYAIEKKETALQLLEKNKEKFHANNMHIIAGSAPQALEDIEAPTHAFIGGSSGNLKEIVSLLVKKNPKVQIVITAITLETISQALEVVKNLTDFTVDIAYVTVAKAKKVADYHMMMGQNPVAIFTIQKEI